MKKQNERQKTKEKTKEKKRATKDKRKKTSDKRQRKKKGATQKEKTNKGKKNERHRTGVLYIFTLTVSHSDALCFASNSMSTNCGRTTGLAGNLVKSTLNPSTLVRSNAGAGVDGSVGGVRGVRVLDRVDLWSVGGGGASWAEPDSRVFSRSSAPLAESSRDRRSTKSLTRLTAVGCEPIHFHALTLAKKRVISAVTSPT